MTLKLSAYCSNTSLVLSKMRRQAMPDDKDRTIRRVSLSLKPGWFPAARMAPAAGDEYPEMLISRVLKPDAI